MVDWIFNMSSAPKDRPILVYCDHSKAPKSDDSGRLTAYEAWCEGEGYIKEPFMCVAKWGGGFNDGEADGGASMPDWWFLHVLDDYLGTPL